MKLTIDDKAKSFGVDFLSEINKYPFGRMNKTDYECLIFGLLEKHGMLKQSTREMSVQLQVSPTIVKNLRLRYHIQYEPDQCKENVKEMFEQIFKKENHSKIDYDNGTFIFIVDNPVMREDFRSYMEQKGYYTDTSFNNNIIKVKSNALLDCLKENQSELFNQICEKIDKTKIEEEIKTKIRKGQWQELKSELPSHILTIGTAIASVII